MSENKGGASLQVKFKHMGRILSSDKEKRKQYALT